MTTDEQRDALLEALNDIANRAVRIREDKAVVGIEASFIERTARDAIVKDAIASIESSESAHPLRRGK